MWIFKFLPTGLSLCPDNVRTLKFLHLYADTCVLFVRDTKSWEDARSYCRRLGGDLVMIKDADKQQFMLNALSQDHWDQDEVWIGANDKQHEGDWRWIDGKYVL